MSSPRSFIIPLLPTVLCRYERIFEFSQLLIGMQPPTRRSLGDPLPLPSLIHASRSRLRYRAIIPVRTFPHRKLTLLSSSLSLLLCPSLSLTPVSIPILTLLRRKRSQSTALERAAKRGGEGGRGARHAELFRNAQTVAL